MEHFQGFIITDEFGTQYTFGGSDMAFMEYSIDFFEQGTDTWICNAWYLKSIVRHTGQAVNFTYERGHLVNQMYFSVYNKTSKINGDSYWPNGLLDITSNNNSKGGFLKTSYKYNFNLADAVNVAMVAKNIVAPAREVFHYTGSDALPSPIKLTTISYNVFNGLYLPQIVTSKYGNSASSYTDAEFLTYDARGNLLTFKEQNGPVNKLEYYGIADIGKTDLLKKRTIADGTLAAQTVSYNYKPLIGVETIQDPNAKTIFYEYDFFNRLKSTLTNNAGGSVRSSFCYNYAGQIVDCAAISPAGSVAASTLFLMSLGKFCRGRIIILLGWRLIGIAR
ncbi:hypothetical protein [Dyadobacter sp. CY323]|uniref:hypothetical protein n=1 Tax=Dyadobacter sp. CY323 TaxID=2907302 RepID=UPI001F22A4A5|nr:hypothetical protein [Dyadobacter sp. CY323]MCE6992281.1 hypothetical protein [Dyadobacter sp. CY323]